MSTGSTTETSPRREISVTDANERTKMAQDPHGRPRKVTMQHAYTFVGDHGRGDTREQEEDKVKVNGARRREEMKVKDWD